MPLSSRLTDAADEGTNRDKVLLYIRVSSVLMLPVAVV